MALRPVNLVQVDDIGLQTLQAGVARSHDVFGRHAIAFTHPRHTTRRACDFGGQHDFLPRTRALGQPVANDGFCRAKRFCFGGHRINFGGVDEVDTACQRMVEDVVCVVFFDLFTKGHGAQANGCDMQVAVR